jgi:hypothetical protein
MIGLFNFKKTRLVYREVKNYFFILSSIDKNSGSQEWNNYKLRSDLIGRIYTVISLREEDMGEIEEMRKFRVLERMKPINNYLTSLGLQEVLIPNIQEIDDSRSYLVTYNPYFDQFSWSWLALNLIFPIGLILQFTLF